MKNNKRMNIIITSFVMVLVLIGGTLAYLSWQSNEEQKTKIVFTINDGFECAADGGGDITNNDVMLAPASCTNSKYAIQREVIVSPTITNSSLAVTMDLWLNIDNLGTGLSESENFKYALTTSPTSCDGTEGKVISSGNFNGLVEGDQVALFDEKIYRKSMNDKYYLYVWLDTEETSSATQNQTFSLSLGGTCVRSLKVEEPILVKGMVPVTISDNGKVTTISSDDVNWYNYEKQEWANIVLVNENATDDVEGSYSREYYLNNPDTEVLESDILAYYVWIPRYKYKIWTTGVSSAGNEQPIDIVFESADDPINQGTNVDEYRTHPAFLWDSNSDGNISNNEVLPGIWVGKFETTGDATIPTVKPNMSSLVNQTVSTQFTTALKFAGGSMNDSTGEVTFIGNDTYGLTDVTDSHMMKNSEWGAVAYLSHSQYGINEEIRINNYYNSGTLTGCGALTENEATATTCGIHYGTPSTETHTYPQSTTGNITGVFDMSGGVWDAVMGNYNKTTGSSGFTLYPVSKYYDNYTTEDVSTACNGGICYGHALNETNGWYGDTATFLSSEKTWFYRGGKYSNTTVVGNFNYSTDKGPSSANYTFRSVLIPKMNYTVNFDVNGGNLVDISYTTAGQYEFVALSDKEYQLEVWGAQGGSVDENYIGGYGGYSKGIVKLKANQVLNIYVGGQGTMALKALAAGGYNGGGESTAAGYSDGNFYFRACSGGGATHIATESGLLEDLSGYAQNHDSPILIVAGGGGGASQMFTGSSTSTYIGGSGGGYVGKAGGQWSADLANNGGTQTSTSGHFSGTFGAGVATVSGGGGGGGYYGGSSAQYSGAGGGSGYIASNSLTDKYMYCYNCATSSEASTRTYTTTDVSDEPISNYAKSGSGAARISQPSSKIVAYGKFYGSLPTPYRDGYAFLGWYTEDGVKITESTIVNTKGNITLYAQWEPVSVNISYSVNGGIIQSTTTSDSAAYNMRTANNNTTYNLRPINSTTYNWSTTNDIIYLNNQALNTKISMLETKSLLSYNDVNYMNITKEGHGVPDDKEWLCLSGCKSNNLRFSQNVEYTFTDFCDNLHTGCNVVLGVNFAKKFAVSFNVNGGNGGPDSQVKLDENTLILSSFTPTRDGYTFLGWSEDPDATSATFAAGSEFTINDNVTLYAIWEKGKYTESILNGTDPELESGMIPVTISDTGAVTVADITQEWYNYGNKEWANAVLVNSTSRSTYINQDGTFNANTPIPEANILAYYVWIPRYKYTFPKADGKPETISIIFENNQTDKSIPASGKASGTDYYTHPAFTFGTKELNGIWVGKFETTGTGETPTILPDELSLVEQDVSTQFKTAISFAGGSMNDSTGAVSFTGNNTYGLTNTTDSHMMKNSEWGAVVYLSHSQYGINEEIRINNYVNIEIFYDEEWSEEIEHEYSITGCGAATPDEYKSETCGIPYGTPSTESNTYPQSTTGNITGVFDMSGGIYEYVMAKLDISSNDSSNFNILPSSKYYNLYLQEQFNGDDETNMDKCTLETCGGQALYETLGWYNDYQGFVEKYGSWFIRGGSFYSSGSAGAFGSYSGDAGWFSNNSGGFRAVLVKGS